MKLLMGCFGIILLSFPGIGSVASPGKSPSPLPANSLENFAAALKFFLQQNLPATLYEKSHNWDHQSMVNRLRGLKVVQVPRNDGIWQKIKVTTRNLPGTLEVNLYDLHNRGQDRISFKCFLAFQTGVDYEKQIWESGVRLFSGGIRARLRIKLDLALENLIKLDFRGGLIPDVIFRLKVTEAKVSYDNMVMEHINGVGGSAARWTGETLRSALKQWKPSLEKDLLAKAGAAILKAGDTREIRLSLGKLTSTKEK